MRAINENHYKFMKPKHGKIRISKVFMTLTVYESVCLLAQLNHSFEELSGFVTMWALADGAKYWPLPKVIHQ